MATHPFSNPTNQGPNLDLDFGTTQLAEANSIPSTRLWLFDVNTPSSHNFHPRRWLQILKQNSENQVYMYLDILYILLK